jgi:plasmid stabilization system protein ParE
MTLIVLDDAEDEFREAVLHYESITPDLGKRFKEEVFVYVSWIIQNPISPRLRPRGYRRVNLRVFPYYIAYIIHEDEIWIVAITNGRRKPHYWIQRKQKIPNS